MNIKRYDIFPVNHQSGNEIESAGGRYVRFADVEHLQQRLTAAEQRNAELVDLLRTHTDHIATLCDVMFRFGLGMYKEPEQKIYSALVQQQVVFAALKPIESGASE